jgi:hypothetical protein
MYASAAESRPLSLLSWAVLLAGVGAGVASAYIVISTYSPLPSWDEWALFDHLARGGGWSLRWLWQQHNEHRIFTTKLLFLLDTELFHGRQILLLACIFVSQILQAVFLSWSLRALRGWRGSMWRLGTGLIAYCILCPTQYENLVWGFQLQFVLTAWMATVAVMSLLLYRRDERRAFLVAGIAAATIATWSLANGMLLWPLLVAAALWLRMKPHVWRAFVIAGTLNIALYFYGYRRPAGDAGMVSIGESLRYVAVYFGSTFVRHSSGAIATLAGAAGIVVALALVCATLKKPENAPPLLIELSLILLFTLATAAVTSTGRLHLGLEQATASRYQTFALLFWACLGLALLSKLREQDTKYLAGGLLVAMLGFATQVRLPLIDAQWRQLRLEKISLALLAGVHDGAVLAEAYPDPQVVLRASEYMRQHKLSIFAGARAAEMGESFDTEYREVPSNLCAGAITSSEALPSDGGKGLRITGYAWDRAAQRPVQNFVVVTDDKISGFGVALTVPVDLLREHDPATASRFGWVAYSRGPEATKIYALLGAEKQSACLIATVSP